jgi:hypothetical protein
MKVCGADFSGAKSPDIYYAVGEFTGESLFLGELIHCDDRLDLYAAVRGLKGKFWGLDFPFALPSAAYPLLGLSNWDELLEKAALLTRHEFVSWLDRVPTFETRCRESSVYCRYTDAYVQSYSCFKRFNPAMRAMFYSGLKLLAYLKLAPIPAHIYPFGMFDDNRLFPHIFEVYPSHTWRKVGLRRTTNLMEFIERFNTLGVINVTLSPELHLVPTQDAADSIVACITTAAALTLFNPDIDTRPPHISPFEWDARHLEGLIVRI